MIIRKVVHERKGRGLCGGGGRVSYLHIHTVLFLSRIFSLISISFHIVLSYTIWNKWLNGFLKKKLVVIKDKNASLSLYGSHKTTRPAPRQTQQETPRMRTGVSAEAAV